MVLLTGLVSGCAASGELRAELEEVRSALIDVGFDDAGVHVGRLEGGKVSEDVVTVVLVGGGMANEDATQAAARVVWDELPLPFDTLVMDYNGQSYRLEYREIERHFGPRPDGLDDISIRDAIGEEAQLLVGLLAAFGLFVLAILAVLIVWRARRHAERRAKSPPA
ncbi:hypothetical protein [Promicromonospora sp. NPDC090134]|uniref:hypothetical protein n=1 Tax=Promicromonospora sp. NPDC090134 TaxID=3364408 RepID=UPI003822D190